MADELSILINGKLNEKQTTNVINSQIERLSSQLKTLQLNFNDGDFKDITQKMKTLQDQITKMSKNMNVFDPTTIKSQTSGFVTEINKAVEEVKQRVGSINNLKTNINYDKNGNLKGFILQVEDAQKQVQKFKYTLEQAFMETSKPTFKLDNINVVNSDKITQEVSKLKTQLKTLGDTGNLTQEQITRVSKAINGVGDTSGLSRAKQAMAELADTAKLAQQMAEGREKAQSRSFNEIQKLEQKQAEATNRNLDNIRKQEQAEQALNQKLEQQLELYKKNAQINAENLTRRFGSAVDDRSITTYLKDVNALSTATPNLQHKMKQLGTSFKEISAEANTSGSHVMGFGERFSTALRTIPAWLASTTVIFGSVHALKSVVSSIEMINQKMTELKRVMPTNTDFNGMLQNSIKLSEQLGRKLSDVLDIQNEFARQGYSGNEIQHLTKVAALLQNISDLTPQESLDAIISGMKNFNVSAKDSIKIANELNQVDNTYSVTTQQLGTSLFKAASTAKVYGVSMEQLIGQTTAIAEVTRESGNVVGNSLKTLYSRLLTFPKSVKMLSQLGISVTKSNGAMKSATQVLNELYQKWGHLTSAQKENLGVAIAGRRQLSRFFALMNNYGDAIKATNTALHAQGSAARENAQYQKSLEAQINKLSTAWQAFALSLGQGGVTGIFAGVIHGLTALAHGGTDVVHEFGLLPPVVAAATTALMLFNHQATKDNGMLLTKTIKGLITNFRGVDDAFAASTIKTRLFGTASSIAAKSAKGLKIALTSIGEFTAGAILPVAAVTLLSIGVEKLISHFEKLHEQQAKFKQQSDQMLSDYTKHQGQLNKQLQDYYDLSNKKSQNGGHLSSAENKKYLDVQNSINKLMPSLTQHVSQNGQAHLKAAENIKTEIQYVKELKKNQEKLSVATYQQDVQKFADSIHKLQNQLQSAKNISNTKTNTYYQGDGLYVHTQKSAGQQVKDQQQVIFAEHQLQVEIQKTTQFAKQKADAFLQVSGASKHLTNADQQLIQSFINAHQAQLKQAAGTKNFESVLEGVINKTTDYGQAIANLQSVLGKNANLGFAKGMSSNEVNSLASLLKNVKAGKVPMEKFAEDLKHIGLNGKQTKEVLDALSGGFDKAGKSADNASKAVQAFNKMIQNTQSTSAYINKTLYGFNSQDVTNAKDLIAVYEALSHVKDKNAQETTYYNQALKELQKMFPGLVSGHKANVQAINGEITHQEILLKATQMSANGQLNAQQQLTLDMAQEAVKRKKIVQQEIDQYKALLKAAAISSIADNGRFVQNGAINNDFSKIQELEKELNNIYVPNADQAINELGKSINYMGDSAKKTSSSTKKMTYVTNQLQEALSKVNTELTNMKNLQSSYPQWSSQYRDSLKQEIQLLQQKSDLYSKQESSLKQQISSGNIVQYGMISQSVPSSSSSFSSSGGGGNYSGKYSSYINQASSRYGVPSALIAAVIKAESGFNAGARSYAGAEGLMQLMPSTARGLGVSNPYNAYQNIMGGTKYLANLLREFNGSIRLAVAAYNAGPGAVKKYGGIPPYAQTEAYVPRVMGYYRNFGASGGSVSVSSSGGSSANNKAAQRKQAIDQAKQQLLSMGSDASSIQQQIQQIQYDIVKSRMSQYDWFQTQQNDNLAYYQMMQSELDPTQYKAWRHEQELITDSYKKQASYQKEKVSYIKKELEYNSKLSPASKADLQSQLISNEQSLYSLLQNIYQAELAFKQSELNQTIQNMNDKYNSVAVTNTQSQLNHTSGTDYLLQMTYNRKLLQQYEEQRSQAENNVKKLEQEKKSLKGFPTLITQINQQITNWQQKDAQLYQSIHDTTSKIQGLYQNVANKIVSAYKSAYQSKQQIETDALNKEMSDLDTAHNKRMQYLDDELNKYQDIINKKLQTISNANNTYNYNQQLSQLDQQKQGLQNQINNYGMDTSESGKAQVNSLTKQLISVNDQITQLQHQRKVSLEQQALQDQLNNKQQEITTAKNNETNNYNQQKTDLQNQINALNKKYQELINDQSLTEKISEDLTKHHYQNILTDFNNFKDLFSKNAKDLGTIISKNLIDTLTNAEKSITSLEQGSKRWTNADITYKGNKLSGDYKQTGQLTFKHGSTIYKMENGKIVGHEHLNKGAGARVYGYNAQTGMYDVGGGYWAKASDVHFTGYNYNGKAVAKIKEPVQVYVKKDGEFVPTGRILKAGSSYKAYGVDFQDGMYKLGGNVYIPMAANKVKYEMFDTGGYTGNSNGLAMLHSKELVLNKEDTKNFLKGIGVLRNIDVNNLGKIIGGLIPKMKSPELSSNNNQSNNTNIKLDIHIDKVEGSQKGANDLFKGINNNLKRYGVTFS